MKGNYSAVRIGSLLLVAMFAVLGPAHGQELRAKLRGQVTDSSGGAIVGAKLALRNVKTGVEVYRQSNEVGLYLFDYVSAGTYSLSVEAPGFAGFVQQNIEVANLGDVTVNAELRPGMTSETITVKDSPPDLQFNTSSLHTNVDTKMANDLPVMNRNVFLMASLDPSVVIRSTSEQQVFDLWAPTSMDIGGNTNMKNDLLVDGTPSMVGPKASYNPPMDAVEELSVQQNSVDAEFGHSAGGIISLQLKSGTNEIHGTAYYLGRNPSLNAVPDSTNHMQSEVRNHIGGGSIGLPIKKNRIFNFTAFEKWLNRQPISSAYTLPTALERQGDYSQSLNGDGGQRTIYDPWTTQYDAAAGTSTRVPFAGNVIPQSRMDASALTFLHDIWQPNNPGDDATGVNNFRATNKVNINYWNLTSRTDAYLSDRLKTFFRYSQFRTFGVEDAPVSSPAWYYSSGFASHSLQLSGDVVWTISPTTVFDARVDYISIRDAFDDPKAELKESDLARFWPNNPWYKPYTSDQPIIMYPNLQFNSDSGSTQFGRAGFWYQVPNSYVGSAKISRQMGSHYAKLGGEYRALRITASRPHFGGFSFDPTMTADTFVNPNTGLRGDPYASFLLGAIDDNSTVGYVPLQKPQTDYFAFYFQDDFKVTSRLTLNLGLRYEYETAMRDAGNRLSRYLDLANPIPELQSNPPQLPAEVTALRETQPVYNGAWMFTDSSHRGSWNAQKLVFLPRAGLAYRMTDRTSVRVGWARYIVPPMLTDGFNINTLGSTPYPGFDAQSSAAPALEGIPQARLNDPFPASNPLIAPMAKTLGRYTNMGGAASWFHQDFHGGVSDRINFSLQRQLPQRLVLDATYFLNLSHDLPLDSVGSLKDLNQVDPQLTYTYKGALSQKVANPFYQALTPETFPGQLRNQEYVSVSKLLRPYPQYGKLTEMAYPALSDRYQALQLKLQRPFVGGFTFVSGYSYNRERGQQYYDELDRFNNHLTWMDSVNPRHRLSIGGVYELPVGRGRLLWRDASRLADGVAGGWSLSAIYRYNTGDFLQFDGVVVSGNPRIDNPTYERMFDTSVLSRLPDYTRATNPRTFAGVNGPSYRNLDLTLSKGVQLAERFKLELRLESYNVTNSFMGDEPVMDIDSSLFGRVVSQRPGTWGRQLQYSARLIF